MKGPLLFKYICEKEEYAESDVRNYSGQLFSALNWLHQNDIVHLDVKVIMKTYMIYIINCFQSFAFIIYYVIFFSLKT